MSQPSIRDALAGDLPAISAIYNYYVLHSTCTYQLEPESLADRQAWFDVHSPDKYPVIVAETNGQVVGWGSLSKFHARAGYAPTVEASVYIAHDFHRRGVGRTILQALVDRARSAQFHTVIGGASADQSASLALQERLGFVRVGHLKEVGDKFGKRLDVVYMQLML
ncbi:MAG TPA: GNAT family N-acetyltransferase [Pirellulales bacterium]|jgi:phosphinothricin acetyltransferase